MSLAVPPVLPSSRQSPGNSRSSSIHYLDIGEEVYFSSEEDERGGRPSREPSRQG